ncbi:MAG: preprotein translocase subunit SecY [Clostridia bacterium]|nr:preprotein translocase subunit SecY [Clostridia bacterium]MDD4376256.1 preprotein translocase subunit SecY [Clostridia bacterium]
MFKTLKDIFSLKDLRKKIIYTLLIIVLYRVGTYIVVPGINKLAFNEAIGGTASGILSTINIIAGGAFKRFSIFAMTISPYITASIVLNLLQVVLPSLERLAKEGETGKKTLEKYTKYLTIAFAIVESVGLYFMYKNYLLAPLTMGAGRIMGMALFVISLTAGTSILMWLADKITENGIGNGISIIIFTGIVSSAPAAATALVTYAKLSPIKAVIIAALVIAMIIVIAGVVLVQQAERKIPVNYAKRVVGRKMFGGQNTHIPIKVAMAGVMPIIFSMSFMVLPSTIIEIVTKGNATGFWKVISEICSGRSENIWYIAIYAAIYTTLIIMFTFIYTMFMVNPVEMSNQLKKNGGFIPGIRAGKPTAEYIQKVLSSITWAGGFFLATVAILPVFVQAGMKDLAIGFGGTSVLIVVSVALEMLKNVEGQMVSRHYKGFLE